MTQNNGSCLRTEKSCTNWRLPPVFGPYDGSKEAKDLGWEIFDRTKLTGFDSEVELELELLIVLIHETQARNEAILKRNNLRLFYYFRYYLIETIAVHFHNRFVLCFFAVNTDVMMMSYVMMMSIFPYFCLISTCYRRTSFSSS